MTGVEGEFRRHSVELTKEDVNQVSDLRLLSLYCIYLFSEKIEKSITKYLGTDAHLSSIPLFSCGKPDAIDPIFQFENNIDKGFTRISLRNKVEKSELAKAKGKRKLEDVIPKSWIRQGTCTSTYKKTKGD
ncbi:hypothetical protein K501DRAFT_272053 [Backusella circina FSU 941]|nr:hypothetical protein K501DRAFT_272053 [Backusella circina FSU 941]